MRPQCADHITLYIAARRRRVDHDCRRRVDSDPCATRRRLLRPRAPPDGSANSRCEIFAGGITSIDRAMRASGMPVPANQAYRTARRRPSTLSRTARSTRRLGDSNATAPPCIASRASREIARALHFERSAPDSAFDRARQIHESAATQRPPASPIGPVPCRLSGLASIVASVSAAHELQQAAPGAHSLSIRRSRIKSPSRSLSILSIRHCCASGRRARHGIAANACAMTSREARARLERWRAIAIIESAARAFLCTGSVPLSRRPDSSLFRVLIVPSLAGHSDRVPLRFSTEARATLRSNGRR